MTALSDDFDPEYDIEPFAPSEPLLSPLPSLSARPTVHPGCCLAVSAPLLAHLTTLLPPSPRLTLSVGSGYGLLEALLLAEPHCLNIVGIEVQPSPNRYIPALHHRIVPGTRFLEPLAAESTAWLFIYPRRVGLVEEYVATYGKGGVEKVIWIGPMVDWEDYKGCFGSGWDVQVRSTDEVGGRAWELIAMATKVSP